VLEVTGSKSEVLFVHPEDERTKDDPMVRQPDISRARQVLGWEPAVSLEEGLTRTIEWFKGRLGA
jgi:dTDP-glucose 4,6-dehydratase